LIRDNARTPFNIGQEIYLRGFRKVEAQPLIQGLREKVSDPERVVEEILEWTEGQPFLTQKLCKLIYECNSKIFSPKQLDVRDFVRSKVIDNWEAQDDPIHLRNLQARLLDSRLDTKKLLETYQKILKDGEIDYDSTQELIHLRLTGLVSVENSKLKVYNRIYREIFNEAWVKLKLSQGSSKVLPKPPTPNSEITFKKDYNKILLSILILALGAGLVSAIINYGRSTLEKW
jgi:primosomal protein N'